MTTLSIRGLTQRYGDTVALADFDLTLDRPGIHGLLGRNGSGKTTLMSAIAGLRKPDAGTMTLDGMPIYENFAATSQICIIREDADTTDEWSETIREAFEMAADMRPYWTPTLADRLLEMFKLAPKMKVNTLSRGQRAKLAATLGLAARAPLTLFDEVYLGMDAPSRYQFYDLLLKDYMDHPRIVLVSSHHIEEVAKLFEDVIIIGDGRLMIHESADALRGRGLTLTGPAAAIDALTGHARILSTKALGPTKAVAVYDAPASLVADARQAGMSVEPLPLQDIFVHLTASGKDAA